MWWAIEPWPVVVPILSGAWKESGGGARIKETEKTEVGGCVQSPSVIDSNS